MTEPEPDPPHPTGEVGVEIRAGIEAAARERRPIDHRTARLIAEQLSDQLGGGPDGSGPLQRLAQTGQVMLERNQSGVDTGGLLDEIGSLMDWAIPADWQPWLDALAAYALAREVAVRPMPDWRQVTGA